MPVKRSGVDGMVAMKNQLYMILGDMLLPSILQEQINGVSLALNDKATSVYIMSRSLQLSVERGEGMTLWPSIKPQTSGMM